MISDAFGDARPFLDEVRNGFFITSAVKTAWHAEMDILKEVDRVCRKYNIQYFADWGSLLAAVRHGGYIPWDDDLDICMKRRDYELFIRHSDELPEEYFLSTYKNSPDHWFYITRVQNEKNVSFDSEYLKNNYYFPYIACVDIFILDNIYRDDEKEKARDKKIMYILALADGIRKKTISDASAEKIFKALSLEYGFSYTCPDSDEKRSCLAADLYGLAESFFSAAGDDESDNVGYIFPWTLKGSRGYPKKWFENAVRLPYEDMTIPVPHAYTDVLAAKYGQYMVPYHVWGGHDYPFFERQRENIEKITGLSAKIKFNKEMLRDRSGCDKLSQASGESRSLKSMARQCMEEIKSLFLFINDSTAECAENIQTLAIELGELIEKSGGEDNDVVHALEELCEAVYQYAVNHRNYDALSDVLKKASDIVSEKIIKRRETLFLITRPDRLDVMRELMETEKKRDGTVVTVVFLPFSLKGNEAGDVTGFHIPGYKNISYKDYRPDLHYPAVIYIQDLYDDWNGSITLPNEYYSAVLKASCEKMVYVLPDDILDFSDEDTSSFYSIGEIARSPGLLRSDRIIVGTENIRKHLIYSLTDLSGLKYKKHWEDAVTVFKIPETEEKDSYNKNKTLICLGLDTVEKSDCDISRLAGYISLYNAVSGDYKVWLYPDDIREWENYDRDATLFIKETFKGKLLKNELEGYDKYKAIADDFHEYRGDPSPVAYMMKESGKNVILRGDMK